MSEQNLLVAENFIAGLVQQRQTTMKGGIYHLTQISMAYESNRIEGSTLTSEQTRYLYETASIVGDANLQDVIETTNHFRAFDLAIDSAGSPLTVERIKQYHQVLKSGTQDSRRTWFAVRDWKQVPNSVGGIDTAAPEDVDAQIKELLADYPAKMTLEDIAAFHYRFEMIHPFQDGNGRVGRLIMFEQALSNGVMPFVVSADDRAFYYRGLSNFRDEPGFLIGTLLHSQDQYCASFADFVSAQMRRDPTPLEAPGSGRQ